jgi:hypothetical protein
VAGRFALLTDENVDGPLIKALRALGWDVERAVDVFGERTDDEILFAYAAEHGRVFVTGDRPAEAIAIRWLSEARSFRGMVRCQTGVMSVGDLVTAFEKLAEEGDPFGGYPIVYLKP